MFFPSLTTQLWSSSHHNSTVKTCQYCFFLTSRANLKWELLPKTLPLAEASGNYRHPACLGTITSHHSTQEPQKNIFHSCQQWQKAPKYCWVTAATDVAHVSISGKATNVCRKHCLKKCQFPLLANSSACFQIQRSSFFSSRDQFDRQILLIPKCVISLCDHLPFYLECWLESDPGANRNVNINFLKLFISENWKRQTCLLIYTLSPLVQMLETFTVPSAMYTCHSWKWQMWDDPQLHFEGREKYQWYFS